MSRLGDSDSVDFAGQNESSVSAGGDSDVTSSLTNETSRSGDSALNLRLGISHMMVWIGCCAAYMGAMRFIWPEGQAQDTPSFFLLITALYSLSGGAFLAGVILFVARRFHGATFPLHAGEWLLTLKGFAFVFVLIFSLAARLVTKYPINTWGYSSLLTGWFFLWPALGTLEPPRWKLFFWAVFLADFSLGLVAIMPGMTGQLGFVGITEFSYGALLLWCVWRDRQTPLSRPWTHWVGVLAGLWHVVLYMTSLGVVLFLYTPFGRM